MKFRVPRNIGWKLGALLLSVLLWIAVSAEPDLVTSRAVPILYRNLASQFLVTGDVPESVRVEIRGSAAQLSSSSLADTVALFDLGVIDAAGQRTFTISNDNLNLPRGVTFLRAMPSQLRLRIARLTSKDVPVQVRITGAAALGISFSVRNTGALDAPHRRLRNSHRRDLQRRNRRHRGGRPLRIRRAARQRFYLRSSSSIRINPGRHRQADDPKNRKLKPTECDSFLEQTAYAASRASTRSTVLRHIAWASPWRPRCGNVRSRANVKDHHQRWSSAWTRANPAPGSPNTWREA